MCTAATYQSAGFYFGRTLDYEVSYGNQIVITPRNYTLRFRHTEDQPHHYAIIGMGLVARNASSGTTAIPAGSRTSVNPGQ